MTSITTHLEAPRQDPRRRVRTTGDMLVVMTVLQLAFGAALLIAPGGVNHLLSGALQTSPELAYVLRVASAGVLFIAVSCALGRLSETGVPRSRPLDLVPGLVVYNGCAIAIIGDALIRGVRAPLLWPAFAVHLALLAWCIACLALERAQRR
jgi:hypothetical protein